MQRGVSSKSSSGSNQTTGVGVPHRELQESLVLFPGLWLNGGSGGQVGKGLAMQLDNQPAQGPLGTVGPSGDPVRQQSRDRSQQTN